MFPSLGLLSAQSFTLCLSHELRSKIEQHYSGPQFLMFPFMLISENETNTMGFFKSIVSFLSGVVTQPICDCQFH